MSGPAARVRLKKKLARAIAGGHPWIWRDAIAGAPRLADGAGVAIETAEGRVLAHGFWDARSPIAVRVITDARTRDVAPVIGERVAGALARRLEMIDRQHTDAFRWIHGEADHIPGVHADLYGAVVVLRYDGGGARAFYTRAALPERLRETAKAVGLRLTAVGERRRGDEGGARPLLGTLPAREIEVAENGLRFGVDLVRGQKGGLFLDQRDNRALVRTLAKERRVLNLFGYTGGFSIYAAAGGAHETVTVDAAAPAIAAARRNFERNGLDISHARLVTGDAFEFLERTAAAGERFDLVISDPPAFAPSRRALPAGLRAYRRLHTLAAQVTAPGGLLCAASCSSHVDRAAFLATVHEGARDAGRRYGLREIRGAAPDHPVLAAFPEGDYLKFAVGGLE
jgi:23S rRNA (cytosine1962-C5)-methyltransferase